MGLAYIKQRSATSILGLWIMEESLEELNSDWTFTEDQLIDYKKRVTDKRKKEWLTARLLLNEILHEPYAISYTPDGKPVLSPNDYTISISHSQNYLAILVDSQKEVGIDIQKIKKKIPKTLDYFLQPAEIENLQDANDPVELTIYWATKEAIFKYIGLATTNMKTDIRVKPFRISGTGIVTALVSRETFLEEIILHYTHFDDYIMATTT